VVKRLLDISISLLLLLVLAIPMMIITVVIKLTSKGPAIHWSKRVGVKNQIFLMPKFRSMYIETPQVATHLLKDSNQYVTPIGRILRKTSLDELPQVWSVFIGDMSLVGPRPALFNQDDLVALRTNYGIEQLRPGVTGWAQINGRDDLPIPVKVEFDKEYKEKQSVLFDLKILVLTFVKVLKSDGVSH
jgi:O-antigen biosynthesis protein WbqP